MVDTRDDKKAHSRRAALRHRTCFDAWLAMHTATSDGLVSSSDAAKRWVTKPIYNATEHEAVGLERIWREITAAEAHKVLSRPDVTVTNLSDKHVQLEKLEKLDQRVREVMATMAAGAGA